MFYSQMSPGLPFSWVTIPVTQEKYLVTQETSVFTIVFKLNTLFVYYYNYLLYLYIIILPVGYLLLELFKMTEM